MTHVAATPRPDNPPQGHRQGLLGLPAKLALLALLAVAACTLLLAVFADRQLTRSANEQARAEALTLASAASSSFQQDDFAFASDEPDVTLTARLGNLRKQHADLAGIGMYGVGGLGGLSGRLIAEDGHSFESSDSDRLLRKAAASSEPVFDIAGDKFQRLYFPVLAAGARDAVGVIVVAYDRRPIDSALQRSRVKLYLGAVVSASLMGFLLLSLLQRELFRPLLVMRMVMTQIRNGATGVRIGWDRPDELGAVASDFDAMVGELEDAHAELARYVSRDPLTGLLNKESFVDRLSGELTRARREGYSVTLVSLDVDELEYVNQRFDRDAGDNVLRAVGEAIGMGVRPTDISGRIGDDGFQIALVGADAAQSVRVLERLRSEIGKRAVVGPQLHSMTVSMGVAEYPRDATDQMQLEKFAGNALAHAQKEGANRAAIYGAGGKYVFADDLASEDRPAAAGGAQSRPAAELVSTVHSIARALDARSGGAERSRRIGTTAMAIARELDLSDARMQLLRSASVLHDLGSVAASSQQLGARSRDAESAAATAAQLQTARNLLELAGMGEVAEIVAHQQDRWDGATDSEGAREGADIPLESRVLQAASTIETVSTGPGARSSRDATEELRRHSGTRLDPQVVDAAIRLIEGGLLLDAGTQERSDASGAAAA